MLYAVIQRFDSLREITTSLLAETHKLGHIGIHFKIGRSTLADANKRRSEAIFEAIYRDLYYYCIGVLSDSNRNLFIISCFVYSFASNPKNRQRSA